MAIPTIGNVGSGASAAGGNANRTTADASITIQAGTKCLIAAAAFGSNANAGATVFSSVVLDPGGANQASFSLISGAVGSDGVNNQERVSLWQLVNGAGLPTGTLTVRATTSQNVNMVGVAVAEILGLDDADAIGAVNGAGATTAGDPTVTLATDEADTLIIIGTVGLGLTTVTAGADEVELADFQLDGAGGRDDTVWLGYQNAASQTTHTLNPDYATNPGRWAIAVAQINGADAGGPTEEGVSLSRSLASLPLGLLSGFSALSLPRALEQIQTGQLLVAEQVSLTRTQESVGGSLETAFSLVTLVRDLALAAGVDAGTIDGAGTLARQVEVALASNVTTFELIGLLKELDTVLSEALVLVEPLTLSKVLGVSESGLGEFTHLLSLGRSSAVMISEEIVGDQIEESVALGILLSLTQPLTIPPTEEGTELTRTLSILLNTDVILGGDLGLGRTQGVSPNSLQESEQSAALGRLLGVAPEIDLGAIAEALTLSRAHDLSLAQQAAMVGTLSLVRNHGLSLSSAVAVTSLLVVSRLMGVGAVGDMAGTEETVSLSRAQSVASSSLGILGRDLTLLRQLALLVSVEGQALEMSVTLPRAQALLAGAALSWATATTLGRVEGVVGGAQVTSTPSVALARLVGTIATEQIEAGSSISLGVLFLLQVIGRTAAEEAHRLADPSRIFAVSAEFRTRIVTREDRTLVVRDDDRVDIVQ